MFSVNLSGVLTIQTAQAASNNGTLKVQEKGAILPDNSNDPKVCVFRFVADNLDGNQTGNVTIEGQGATPAGVYLVVPISTNASGDGTSAYINETNSIALAAGHYKATLDNKFGTDPGDKAKSKVFKVDCDSVQPTAPTFIDPCATSNDKLVIPTDANAKYQIRKWLIVYYWDDIQPGTYNNMSGTVTIRAVAKTSSVNLIGQTQWDYTYTNATCTTTVTTVAPTIKNDVCGTANDKFTIPAKTGVVYKINGTTVNAGDHATNGAASITITAHPANATYILSGETTWTLTFDTTACPVVVTAQPVVSNDEVCGTANDTYTIPDVTGVQYYVNNVATAPGTYNINGLLTISVTAQAKPGFVLSGDTHNWNLSFTNKTCVTPTAPTKIDLCGSHADKYVIPAQTGVRYKVGNTVKSAGEHQTNNDVVVVAEAINGNYVLTGTTSWPLDFSQQDCPATATKPILNDACGTQGDYFTTPAIEGVDYRVSKFGIFYTDIDSGNHWGVGQFYVKAVAKPGYELTGQTVWQLYLNPNTCKVTATAPTFIDECGSSNDKFTIPTTQNVTYKVATKWIWLIVWIPVEFDEVPAGTYDGAGRVKIVAEPKDVYSIDGDWFWIHDFNSNKCQLDAVTIPTFNDACDTMNDSYTIHPASSVTYKVNGSVVQPGTFTNAAGNIEIAAEATDPNYVLQGNTQWSHNFSTATCADITANAVCSQTGVIITLTNTGDTAGTVSVNGTHALVPANDKTEVTVPYTLFKANVVVKDGDTELFNEAFDCTPGRGNAGGQNPSTPTIVKQASYTGIMLPETGADGGDTIAKAFTVFVAGLVTYGATFFLVNRRTLSKK